MALPQSLTTVTTFSKWFALSMFIVIPIISFYYGRYYQQQVNTRLPLQNPTPSAQEITYPEELNSVINLAKENLANKLSMSTQQIQIVAATAITWNDGSLGCPKPGMMYTQSLVPGYKIILSDGKNQYEYHGRKSGEPFLCENSH